MTKEKRKVTIHIGNGSPMVSQQPGRNTKCKCGSGKKAKHCCGNETKFYNSKANEDWLLKPENHE